MLSFGQAQQALSDMADELPEGIYNELNGGIILLPEEKLHPEGQEDGSLYILGEYRNDRAGLGRYIVIYYGSFVKTHGSRNRAVQLQKLRQVLHHELTHHIESLAGDRSLEKQDAIDIEDFRRSRRKSD